MCPTCGCFDGHFRDCPRINDPDDFFFPEKALKSKHSDGKRKMFGIKEEEEKEPEEKKK